MIASILILIEIVFDAGWLLKELPTVEHSYSKRSANVRICRGSENGSYVIGLFYPFLLTGKYNNTLAFNAFLFKIYDKVTKNSEMDFRIQKKKRQNDKRIPRKII